MAVNVPVVVQNHQFTIIVSLVQVLFLILAAVFTGPAPGYLPGARVELTTQVYYTDFQDVHVALIVGFGFLVAFLRRYGFASFSLSLLIAAVAIEAAIIVRGFVAYEFAEFPITINSLVWGDFSALVVLISFGALIGKITPVQAVVLTIIEVPISVLNEWVVTRKLAVVDAGGSIIVHLFGAVFGLAASKILFKKQWNQSEHHGSLYHSEVFTFIGTAFLWVVWPSFNAVHLALDARHRAIINTYVALIGSTVASFLISQALNKLHHFNIRHIASAALAGGVAMGTIGSIIIAPWQAWVVGTVAGALSIAGFQLISPVLITKASIHDTRGVLSLHALPGLLAAVVSALMLVIYPANTFPGTTVIATGRDKLDQALFQLAGAGITILIAGVTGVITGVILNLKVWNQVKEGEFFSDADFFDTPEDYDFTTKVITRIDHVEFSTAPEHQKLLPTATTTSTVQETTS